MASLSVPRSVSLALGLGLALASALAGHLLELSPEACWTLAVTALCAVWWVFETLPIPATSLIPFAVLPVAGVLDHKAAAAAFGDTVILLLLGGFILSTALEKSGAHRRLALGLVRLVGGGGRRLVLGFLVASAALSMWISNTATTLMLLPLAMAVVQADEAAAPGQEPRSRLAIPLLLAIAYGASIGGVGTPVGTPPNLIFVGVYEKVTGGSYGFLEWMAVAVPAVLLMLVPTWLWLARGLPSAPAPRLERSAWRPAERRVLVVFAVTILLWVTREAPLGGWSGWLGVKGVNDSTVAMAAVVTLFLVPDGEGGALLDWETAARIPWGLLLLFSGGLAIAAAFESSGLSTALGQALGGIAALPRAAMLLALCLSVTFLSEFTSNTALATLLMPILGAAARAAGLAPEALMVPGALAASYAFMMPVGTAPNAIVYGTGRVPVRRMMLDGFVLNIIGAVVLTLVCLFLLS